MRWLPARAGSNELYAAFRSALGGEIDTIKPGLALIVEPYG